MTTTTPAPVRTRPHWITFAVIVLGVIAILAWQFRPRGPAPDTVGWRSDYPAALAEAAAAGKPAFVFFTAQWCPACQYMAHEVIPQDAATTLVRQRVVPIKVDLTAPEPASSALADQFQVHVIPAMLVIDPATGRVLARQDGGLNIGEFTTWLTAAVDQSPSESAPAPAGGISRHQ